MILIVCFYVSAKFVQGTYNKEPEFYNNEVNYGMNYFLSYALFVFMETIFFFPWALQIPHLPIPLSEEEG